MTSRLSFGCRNALLFAIPYQRTIDSRWNWLKRMNTPDLDRSIVEPAYARWAPIYDAVCGPVTVQGRRAGVTFHHVVMEIW
jgi:hypothetical protein